MGREKRKGEEEREYRKRVGKKGKRKGKRGKREGKRDKKEKEKRRKRKFFFKTAKEML